MTARFLHPHAPQPMLGTVSISLFEILQHRRGRVLFLSERNSSRSHLAEALARALGDDVMEVANAVLPLDAHPSLHLADFDVIVNLGACSLPETDTLILNLAPPVPPVDNRADVETFVLFLIEHFRRAKEWRSGVEQASSLVPEGAEQTSPTPPPAAPPLPDAAMTSAS